MITISCSGIQEFHASGIQVKSVFILKTRKWTYFAHNERMNFGCFFVVIIFISKCIFFSFYFQSFVFNIFDKDKSGYIDFEEFLQALSVTSRGSIEAKLDCKFEEKTVQFIKNSLSNFISGAFQLYDIDGNGEIEESEMYQVSLKFHLPY